MMKVAEGGSGSPAVCPRVAVLRSQRPNPLHDLLELFHRGLSAQARQSSRSPPRSRSRFEPTAEGL